VDPLSSTYPFYTPYQFAGNKPIVAIDLDGQEEDIVIYQKGDQGTKFLLGSKSTVYKKAVTNVLVGLGNPTFEFSEELNLQSAERKVVEFLSGPLSPVKGGQLAADLIREEQAIKEKTLSYMFSGDIEKEKMAIKTISMQSNFFWRNPIASFADIIIPSESFIKAISFKPQYLKARRLAMASWEDIGNNFKAFRAHELDGALAFEVKTGRMLEPSASKHGDFQDMVSKSIIDHMGVGDGFKYFSRVKAMNKFKTSIDNHIKKLNNGVDELIIDLKGFSADEVNTVKNYVNSNHSFHASSITYVNDGQ